MKIITIGKTQAAEPNWWHGLQVTCAHCHSIIELETNDKPVITQERHMGGKTSGAISCPVNTCSHRITFDKPA